MKKQEAIYLVKKGSEIGIETVEHVSGNTWAQIWRDYSIPLNDLTKTPKGWKATYRDPAGRWRPIHFSASEWESVTTKR